MARSTATLKTTPAAPTVPPLPTAGPIRRLLALVYDAFLLFGLLVVPLFLLTAVLAHPAAPLQNGSVTHELPSIAPRPVMLAYMIVVVTGFYCYFWRRSGQTLGMQAWRLRVDSRDGGRPGWRQCLLRALVGFFSLACCGLGYLWSAWGRERLTWHDRASDTRVVVLPKRD